MQVPLRDKDVGITSVADSLGMASHRPLHLTSIKGVIPPSICREVTEPQNTHPSLGTHSLPKYVSFHLHKAEFVSSEKVQKELDAVLGPSQLICYEDRKNLPYTNAVIHEIQRYNCIAPIGVPRQCVKDTTLLGLPVPKGTVILPNICSVLSDPEQWETPHQFNPTHFLDKDGNFMSREAFLPFSAGHRVCLGERLARTELFIFFTNLLRAFTFRLPEGVTEINTERILGNLLQPHHYKICAVPR